METRLSPQLIRVCWVAAESVWLNPTSPVCWWLVYCHCFYLLIWYSPEGGKLIVGKPPCPCNSPHLTFLWINCK